MTNNRAGKRWNERNGNSAHKEQESQFDAIQNMQNQIVTLQSNYANFYGNLSCQILIALLQKNSDIAEKDGKYFSELAIELAEHHRSHLPAYRDKLIESTPLDPHLQKFRDDMKAAIEKQSLDGMDLSALFPTG